MLPSSSESGVRRDGEHDKGIAALGVGVGGRTGAIEEIDEVDKISGVENAESAEPEVIGAIEPAIREWPREMLVRMEKS
jgi:hypothetical protein